MVQPIDQTAMRGAERADVAILLVGVRLAVEGVMRPAAVVVPAGVRRHREQEQCSNTKGGLHHQPLKLIVMRVVIDCHKPVAI
jgi:hypothetical protein